MIKAFIFDFDGVIVDTEPLLYKAEKLLLEKKGKKISPNHPALVLGTTLWQTVKIIKKKYQLTESLLNIRKARMKIVRELVLGGELKLVGGAKKLLKKLKGKYKLGIASSSSRQWIKAALERFSIQGYFKTIVTVQDVLRHKPFPDVYLLTSKNLKVRPDECLAIEDTKKGIESVKRAGMKCIALKQEYTKYQDLKKADKIIKGLKEINIKLIESL